MRYEFIGGSSKKFWEIFPVDESAGDWVVRVNYGRIGTTGQENIKVFTYKSAAERYYDEKIREKIKKGYKEVSVSFKKNPILLINSKPFIVEKPKPVCAHTQLLRKNGSYECTACKKTVEFDKPQYNTATPEFETKVRRYFDMGAA